jgi:signal transduction histidine kinase
MRRIVPIDASGAGRQAAALFLLAGMLAVAGIAAPHSRVRDLVVVAVADIAVAGAAWFVPWSRLHRLATVSIAVAGLVILAFSTWAFGGFATGTGPFFVLLFAWVGLHHPPWTAVALAPLTTASYVAPLLATGQPAPVVSSAIVFVPVTTAVAVLVARHVEQLRRAREHIAAAERWRASLMVTLAHDVRTPLTAVRAALEMLEDDDELSPGDRKTLTAAAQRQTARITRLASGLLDIDRVESGSLRLNLRDVPLRRAAEDAVSLVTDAEVAVEIDPDLTARADPERLEQMLVNLTANALRHGRLPIVVSAAVTGDRLRVCVRDHGKGVSDPAALFTRFSGTQSDAGSVGLGLWIVRQLAQAHGGDAHYEPASPGASFVITLPR